jgi:hypothetical protein
VLVLRVVLLVLLKRLQLICEVAQLGIVSSVFSRLDFRLILLVTLNRLASFVVLLS